jgi:hypothetical protein
MEDPASVEYITRFIAGVQQVGCAAVVLTAARTRSSGVPERVLRGALILTKGYSEGY